KRITPQDGVVEADLRNLPARLYAILPAAIAQLELRGPKKIKAGQAFAWSAEVQDSSGKPIRTTIPLRVRLLAGDWVLDQQFTSAAGRKGASGTLRAVLNEEGAQTLEVTELFSGRTARLTIAVEAPAGPARLAATDSPPDAPADTATRGENRGK